MGPLGAVLTPTHVGYACASAVVFVCNIISIIGAASKYIFLLTKVKDVKGAAATEECEASLRDKETGKGGLDTNPESCY